jgi:hypothetical protein
VHEILSTIRKRRRSGRRSSAGSRSSRTAFCR